MAMPAPTLFRLPNVSECLNCACVLAYFWEVGYCFGRMLPVLCVCVIMYVCVCMYECVYVCIYESVSKSPRTMLITRKSLVVHKFPASVCCGAVL